MQIDLSSSKGKQVLKQLQIKLLGEDSESGVKRYILYSNDPASKNFKLFKDFSNKLDFELPTTCEKFACVESSLEINGIETYIVQRDRTDAMKFELITKMVKNQTNEAGVEVIPAGAIRKMIEDFEDLNKDKKVKAIPRKIIEDLLKKNKKVIDLNELKKALKAHEEKQPIKANIPLERLPMKDIRKAEEEAKQICTIKEKIRSPSELHHVHHGIAWRAKYPTPKITFTEGMYILLTNIITALVTFLIVYSVFAEK